MLLEVDACGLRKGWGSDYRKNGEELGANSLLMTWICCVIPLHLKKLLGFAELIEGRGKRT